MGMMLMVTRNIMGITLLLGIFLLDTPYSYAMLEDKIHEALVAIRDADGVNADTSQLVDRFKSILDLMREAENGNLKSCSTKDECISEASSRLDKLITDAKALKESTISRNINTLAINMLVYAPIAGFIASFLTTLLYTNIKSYLKKKVMEMEVKRVEEE